MGIIQFKSEDVNDEISYRNEGGIYMVCDKNNNVETKLAEFAREHHEHGIQCGLKIANIAKEIHPQTVAVVPLYRSCIVVEQNDKEYKEGTAVIHAYADPHWLGGEIDIETLKSDRFHKVFYVQGLREGPVIIPVKDEELGDCAGIHVQMGDTQVVQE